MWVVCVRAFFFRSCFILFHFVSRSGLVTVAETKTAACVTAGAAIRLSPRFFLCVFWFFLTSDWSHRLLCHYLCVGADRSLIYCFVQIDPCSRGCAQSRLFFFQVWSASVFVVCTMYAWCTSSRHGTYMIGFRQSTVDVNDLSDVWIGWMPL